MIQFSRYKDRPAVLLESKTLKAVFLPEDGAKLASLIRRADGKELMAVKSGENYRVLRYDGSYVDAECSAFDDMFPTVDPYVPQDGVYRGVEYPDHGEMCRIPYAVSISDNTVTFSAHSPRFAISYEKTVTVADDGALDIRYRFFNEGKDPFDFLFAGHIMLRGEDGARLLTPFSQETPIEMIFADGDVSKSMPRDRLMGFAPAKGAAYKFYYLEPMKEGFFGLSYPNGDMLSFRFDPEKLPYLGVWLNNGYFQNIYSIAPEPCTVPFDAPDKAAARGYRSVIPPESAFECSIRIALE